MTCDTPAPGVPAPDGHRHVCGLRAGHVEAAPDTPLAGAHECGICHGMGWTDEPIIQQPGSGDFS